MSNAARDRGDEPEPNFVDRTARGKKQPFVLYDNGHGTQVKQWSGGKDGQFINTVIENSFKRQGSEQYETQSVSLTKEELLAVARGLVKGHDRIVEKEIEKRAGPE
jgi:hypothetical protein